MDLDLSNMTSGDMMSNMTEAPTELARMRCVDDVNIYTQVMGTIIFFVVWPFVVLDMKWFPLGRPAAALVGAATMVVFHVVTQDNVYVIEGMKGNLQALYLLIGMMLLSYYFDREGLLRLVALWIFGKNKPFRTILWKVCVCSGLLAAFITNDATSLVMTPLLLGEFIKQGRHKRELLPLCLGIATCANIGSAATVFGNPQNAFIASAAGVALIDFFIALLPAAILGVAANIGLLHLIFFRVMFRKDSTPEDEETPNEQDIELSYPVAGTIADERASIALSIDQSQDPYKTSRIASEREMLYSSENLSGVPKSRSSRSLRDGQGVPQSVSSHQLQVPNSRSVPEIKVEGEDNSVENGLKKHAGAKQELTPENEGLQEGEGEDVPVKGLRDRSIKELIFAGWLVGISCVLVILLVIPPPPTVAVQFNIGLVPFGCGIFTMLVDTIINRKYAFDAMLKIDWTVILMFMGLFTWLNGFQNTCFPEIIFTKLAPYMNIHTFGGVLLFTVFVAIGSNIFSNVPLTILIVNRLPDLCGSMACKGPLGGLLLAWVATIAGNYTLIGSITNLIVAEKARSTAGYHLTFLRYLKFGFASTLVVMFGALPVVYFLGTLA